MIGTCYPRRPITDGSALVVSLPLFVIESKSETYTVEKASSSSDYNVVRRLSMIFLLFALHSKSDSGAGIGPGFGLNARR